MFKQSNYRDTLTADKISEMENPKFDLDEKGFPYAIFPNNDYSWEYMELTDSPYIAHWSGYENAVQLQLTIGM